MDRNDLRVIYSLVKNNKAALLTDEDGDVRAKIMELVSTWATEGKELLLIATTWANFLQGVNHMVDTSLTMSYSHGVPLEGLKVSGNVIVAPVPENILRCAAALKRREKNAEKMTIEKLEKLCLLL